MSNIEEEERIFECKKWNIASELGIGASKELLDPGLAPAHTLQVSNNRMSGCVVCKNPSKLCQEWADMESEFQ